LGNKKKNKRFNKLKIKRVKLISEIKQGSKFVITGGGEEWLEDKMIVNVIGIEDEFKANLSNRGEVIGIPGRNLPPKTFIIKHYGGLDWRVSDGEVTITSPIRKPKR